MFDKRRLLYLDEITYRNPKNKVLGNYDNLLQLKGRQQKLFHEKKQRANIVKFHCCLINVCPTKI